MAEEAKMSKHTNTVASAHKRIDALEGKVDRILALVEAKGGHNKPTTQKAASTKPAAKPAKGKKAKATKAEGATFAELRVALKGLKAAGKAPAGMTCREAIEAGIMDAFGNAVGSTPVSLVKAEPTKAERKAAKKARKEQALLALVEASAPAKEHKPLTPAQEARIDAPRRADGTMTPRSEWRLREALAMTGKYDRFEVDALVEKAKANAEFASLLG